MKNIIALRWLNFIIGNYLVLMNTDFIANQVENWKILLNKKTVNVYTTNELELLMN